MNHLQKKSIWQWIGSIFFLLSAFVFCPSWSSLLFAVSAALLCPLLSDYWSDRIKRTLWIGLIVAFSILGMLVLPSKEQNQVVSIEPQTAAVVLPSASASPIDKVAEEAEQTPYIQAETPLAEKTPLPEIKPVGSGLTVHFIDVGQGDAALIQCDGESMLIDGGTPERSSLIVAYLKKHDIGHLNYVVSTHAHADHIGGLAGALSVFQTDRVIAWTTGIDSDAYNNFKKYVDKQGIIIEKPSVGDRLALGSSDVLVLGPLGEYGDHNDESIVLKIKYGETSFLFMGDASAPAEHDLVAAGADLDADVLKVGHHGSDDATSYVFLREVMPQFSVISCGRDNSYGHPTEATLSRLADAGATVLRTDLHGDVVFTSDGKNISYSTERQADESELFISGEELENSNNAKDVDTERSVAGQPENYENNYYIGNTNSYKFHRHSCSTLPAEKNRVFFSSREEAVAAGYVACKSCDP